MKTTVSEHDFVQAFDDYNRANNFTPAGRRALYDYLTSLEEDTGTEIELDPIAICCDYSEYPNAWTAAMEYTDAETLQPETDDDDEKEKAARAYLEDRTTVIDVEGGGIIIQSF